MLLAWVAFFQECQQHYRRGQVCANRFLFDTVLGRKDNSTRFAREESMVVSDGNAIQDVFSYQ